MPPWTTRRYSATVARMTSGPAANAELGRVEVLVVDDHAVFRSATRLVLAMEPAFSVVAEAASGETAVALAAELRPALVLMDVNLPGMDGIEATRRILAARPDTVVVLLSAYDLDDLPADARTCGAVACFHKSDVSPAGLRQAWAAARSLPPSRPPQGTTSV
jgi:two-component system invasion response regulator UvrY